MFKSRASNARSYTTDKSEPGLGSLFTCKEVLFSPCYAFIREFLFDAVWFIMKLVIPTLNNTYG